MADPSSNHGVSVGSSSRLRFASVANALSMIQVARVPQSYSSSFQQLRERPKHCAASPARSDLRGDGLSIHSRYHRAQSSHNTSFHTTSNRPAASPFIARVSRTPQLTPTRSSQRSAHTNPAREESPEEKLQRERKELRAAQEQWRRGSARADYKKMSRRWMGIMVGVPVLVVTSWELWRRTMRAGVSEGVGRESERKEEEEGA
ncbi:MAG: hypothetical protein M1831_004638 [Alyxoria varia]|nr:MAG: hypothetical protein M1831_004638 [Alyxoria varia]